MKSAKRDKRHARCLEKGYKGLYGKSHCWKKSRAKKRAIRIGKKGGKYRMVSGKKSYVPAKFFETGFSKKKIWGKKLAANVDGKWYSPGG